MKYFIFTPSENLCHVEIGEEFQITGDDRWYILLKRDILSCIIGRETWLDKVGRFIRGETNVRTKSDSSGDGSSTSN